MGELRQLSKYFRRYPGTIVLGLLCILGSNGAAVTVPYLIKQAVDTVLAANEAGDTSRLGAELARYAGWMVAAALISAAFRFGIRQTLIVLSRKIEYDLRQDLWEHLQALPSAFFSRSSTGDLMAHLTNDVNAVRMFLGPVVMYSMDNFTRFLMILAAMFTLSAELTGWALLPLPLMSVVIYFVSKGIHQRFTLIQESFADLSTLAQQTYNGLRVIKSYVREDYYNERFAEGSRDYRAKQLSLARLQALFRPTLYLIPGLSILLILLLGGRLVIADELTAGDLLAFMVYLESLIWPMISFGWIVNILQQAAASMKRLNKLRAEPHQIEDAPDLAPGEVHGDLEFRGVCFRYGDDGPPVLDGIDLHIPAGSTVAIVGRTGSGKSTLVSLIPRLFDPTAGQILVDGRDVREWPLKSLRRAIGVATQEPFLFSETIAHNVAFGLDEPDSPEARERVEQAARVAQLDADVQSFAEGYQTVLGERGITLSGGQKQRSCLARTLAADPRILVLDDSFSAVDTHTEEAILQGLRDELAGRTAILISHRISTVKDADLIAVLDEGRIAERGNHQQLLAEGGIYADMYRRQLLEEELAEIE